MKLFIRTSIALALLCFTVGGFLAWRHIISLETYAIATGVVGSFASIIGLIALASPRLTAKDLSSVDAELFSQVAESLETVKRYEERATAGKEELDRIARERAELELLVRQAAFKAFSEERLRLIAEEVSQRIKADTALSKLLLEYGVAKRRAEELSAEINRDERADLIGEILSEVSHSRRDQPQKILIDFLDIQIDVAPFLRVFTEMFGMYSKFLRR